ncbi:MAG: multifunctional CCA tRNA nucleotidyl transferase/2'3'-cyclic phosphodiesterase/2'nucleotidase/phosphatase [Halothiobacillus sp. 14-56-357]|nr:MAG: multifunctional CCA tRNA nucleotidyl transferase/2'3'-cyclic phosphodiesterase/2'nucleotidase/phosphatase [Halothiobacillus sp. 15-55-196]OZB56224.1 MAG: multifunctional CCA tRNA nucleotidyl transferase/2'3'-cyclic phosphodiesterase/2'nucleotidase/phosphatase [Halothiobacillus sp. 14-56-357]OZB78655.1 MAG: multifunctional CCA tRNA nucleotidyl transferase/2'3'-cyclic phosphodiesterase/2'nucleotidase/phosphatase [Halothiobacillus sp. 13-55-115]
MSMNRSINCLIVGGAVRDRLLGRPVHDRDWVVLGSTPEAMQAQGFLPVGHDFPVFLHPETREEYALARTERKSGRGHQGFTFNADPKVTLEDDLQRRDLTINAMAQTADGTLIDPFDFKRDLDARILRHIGPAFAEDPLRVLRVARFAAQLAPFDFTLAPQTRDLMQAMTAEGELNDLTAERVWQETQKALASPAPARYFDILREVGALAVLFPEVDALFGVPQPEKYHPEIDSGIHTLLALTAAARLTEDVGIRFAVLCHDLGKALTPPEEWPRHIGHEARGVAPATALCERLRVPKAIKELAILVTAQHGRIHHALEMKPATLVDLIESLDGLRRPERMKAVLLACQADARGRLGSENCAYPQADRIRAAAEVIRSVSPQAFVAQGLKGLAIKNALHQARVRLLAEQLP